MNHKFSIITPAHKNTPYHKELYDSILAQTYTNWEWILWLNNDIKRDLLPEEFEKAFAMQTPPGERSNNFVLSAHKSG